MIGQTSPDISLIVYTDQAKGIVTGREKIEDVPDIFAEKEILLAPFSIVEPVEIIHTENGYVLLGKVSHLSNHNAALSAQS